MRLLLCGCCWKRLPLQQLLQQSRRYVLLFASSACTPHRAVWQQQPRPAACIGFRLYAAAAAAAAAAVCALLQLVALIVAVLQCSLHLLRDLLLRALGFCQREPQQQQQQQLLLPLNNQRLSGGRRLLHATAAEGFAAAAAGCNIHGEWTSPSGLHAALHSSKLMALSPVLPVLVQQLPALRLLCLLASRSSVVDAPQQERNDAAAANPGISSNTKNGVYIHQHELSSIAFFAARLEAVVGGGVGSH